MKINGWECTVGEGGTSRAVSHPDNGQAVWIQGRLMASCDMPPDVLLWLIRPHLCSAWEGGYVLGLGATAGEKNLAYSLNPYAGEPPNKDRAVS